MREIDYDREQRCETCKFWAYDDGVDIGSCRRHAPIKAGRYKKNDFKYRAIWPWTESGDWCGDWEKDESDDLPDLIVTEGDRVLCKDCFRDDFREDCMSTWLHSSIDRGVCNSCGVVLSGKNTEKKETECPTTPNAPATSGSAPTQSASG